MTQQKIQPPEVFISYSHKDWRICDQIVDHLLSCKIVVWIDNKRIGPGESWVDAIFRGLDQADYIIVLISSNALESKWVNKEVETALINTLSQKSSQMIIPVLLENVEMPTMLRTLEWIDMSEGIPHKIPLISDFILKRPLEIELNMQISTSEKKSNDLVDQSHLMRQIDQIVYNFPLAQYASDPDKIYAGKIQQNISELHIMLLRLQAIVEEFGSLSESEANYLWESAGQMMEGPIPGAKRVVELIDRCDVTTTSEATGVRLALLRRYIKIMTDLVKCLQDSFSIYIQIEAPELSSELSQLFRTKINVNRAIKYSASQLAAKGQISFFSPEVYVRYLEATKTFEARVLLQVIDEDARAVAHDPETGWTVFGELVKRNRETLLAIIAARREIGVLIKQFSEFNSHEKEPQHE